MRQTALSHLASKGFAAALGSFTKGWPARFIASRARHRTERFNRVRRSVRSYGFLTLSGPNPYGALTAIRAS
jgi:hypothetical protein